MSSLKLDCTLYIRYLEIFFNSKFQFRFIFHFLNFSVAKSQFLEFLLHNLNLLDEFMFLIKIPSDIQDYIIR